MLHHQSFHILGRLNQVNPIVFGWRIHPLTQRTFHLGMACVANEHRIPACLTVPDDLHMNLGYQGTGGIEYFQATIRPRFPHRLGNSMRAENHGGVIRHLVQFIHENSPGAGEVIDNKPVVNYFMTDIDRRTKQFKRPFDNFDGPVYTGAKSPRIGEESLHWHDSSLLRP